MTFCEYSLAKQRVRQVCIVDIDSNSRKFTANECLWHSPPATMPVSRVRAAKLAPVHFLSQRKVVWALWHAHLIQTWWMIQTKILFDIWNSSISKTKLLPWWCNGTNFVCVTSFEFMHWSVWQTTNFLKSRHETHRISLSLHVSCVFQKLWHKKLQAHPGACSYPPERPHTNYKMSCDNILTERYSKLMFSLPANIAGLGTNMQYLPVCLCLKYNVFINTTQGFCHMSS